MEFPWKKEEDPLEKEKKELAKVWVDEELNSDKRKELIEYYIKLNEAQLEDKKLKQQKFVEMGKAVLGGAVSIGLCLMTLTFESEDILRSKVVPMFLRRRD